MKSNINFRNLFIFLLTVFTPSKAQKHLLPNHLFSSDPTAHIINDKLWLFVCHDQASVNFQGPEDFWHSMMDYHAYSTKDLINWTHHGSILSVSDIPWVKDFSLWDGDAGVEYNGKYYAYVSVRQNQFCIGVLKSDYPHGPYIEQLNRPLIDENTLKVHGIPLEKNGIKIGVMSPTIIFDESNNPYLFFGQFRVCAVKLKQNMTELDGNIFELDIPLKSGEAMEYIEEPMINKINGKYYFSYLTYKNWEGKLNPNFKNKAPGPYIQYCVSEKMFGPFKNPKHLILPNDSLGCNNAATMIQYKGKNIMFYHLPFQNKQHRKIAITEFSLDKNANLKTINPLTDKGINDIFELKITYDAFAIKREAEEFHERKDAFEERGTNQDFHFKLKENGYLLFKDIDFGIEGASGFKAAISCENSLIKDAKLEVRLDAPNGELIAEYPVGFTYWITYYSNHSVPIKNTKGVHDVYLVAKGKNGDAYGRLFNINSFTFLK